MMGPEDGGGKEKNGGKEKEDEDDDDEDDADENDDDEENEKETLEQKQERNFKVWQPLLMNDKQAQEGNSRVPRPTITQIG